MLCSGIEALMDMCGPLSAFHMTWDTFWRFIFCDKSVNGMGEARAIPQDEKATRSYVNQIIEIAQMTRFHKQ